jgi:hypothetical protein
VDRNKQRDRGIDWGPLPRHVHRAPWLGRNRCREKRYDYLGGFYGKRITYQPSTIFCDNQDTSGCPGALGACASGATDAACIYPGQLPPGGLPYPSSIYLDRSGQAWTLVARKCIITGRFAWYSRIQGSYTMTVSHLDQELTLTGRFAACLVSNPVTEA